jgi:hypothetical protein
MHYVHIVYVKLINAISHSKSTPRILAVLQYINIAKLNFSVDHEPWQLVRLER